MNPNGAQTVTFLMSRSSNFTVMDISFIKKLVMPELARVNFVGFGKKREKNILSPIIEMISYQNCMSLSTRSKSLFKSWKSHRTLSRDHFFFSQQTSFVILCNIH